VDLEGEVAARQDNGVGSVCLSVCLVYLVCLVCLSVCLVCLPVCFCARLTEFVRVVAVDLEGEVAAGEDDGVRVLLDPIPMKERAVSKCLRVREGERKRGRQRQREVNADIERERERERERE
jgi:hypothetical protein